MNLNKLLSIFKDKVTIKGFKDFPYRTYFPNEHKFEKFPTSMPVVKIMSIDPGVKNLAIRIEERNITTSVIKTIVFTKINFVDDHKNGSYRTYNIISNFLDEYMDHYKDCDLIIIESQLPRSSTYRISQHIISYLLLFTRENDKPILIFEVSPKIKTTALGAKSGMKYRDIKKWSIVKAMEIIEKNKDNISKDIIDKIKKKDDLSDTICQLEGVISYYLK